jgi:hypothetical protein
VAPVVRGGGIGSGIGVETGEAAAPATPPVGGGGARAGHLCAMFSGFGGWAGSKEGVLVVSLLSKLGIERKSGCEL